MRKVRIIKDFLYEDEVWREGEVRETDGVMRQLIVDYLIAEGHLVIEGGRVMNKCIWCLEEIEEDYSMCNECNYEAMDDIEREEQFGTDE